MSDSKDLPERRVKNVWAATIIVAGILIGIILIVKYNAALGLVVMVAALAVAAIFYRLNNQHHLKKKEDNSESPEFEQ